MIKYRLLSQSFFIKLTIFCCQENMPVMELNAKIVPENKEKIIGVNLRPNGINMFFNSCSCIKDNVHNY